LREQGFHILRINKKLIVKTDDMIGVNFSVKFQHFRLSARLEKNNAKF